MKYSDARPLVEAVDELGAAYREAERVNGDDTASQEDVIAAGERIAVAVAKRNRAFDAATGGEQVELGERGSGVVSETPHLPPEQVAPAQAEGTAEPGAAEKTREAEQKTPDIDAINEGDVEERNRVLENAQQGEGKRTADQLAKEAAEVPPTGGQATEGTGPVETGQQAAGGAQTADAAAQGGQQAETLQTGEQVLKDESPA